MPCLTITEQLAYLSQRHFLAMYLQAYGCLQGKGQGSSSACCESFVGCCLPKSNAYASREWLTQECFLQRCSATASSSHLSMRWSDETGWKNCLFFWLLVASLLVILFQHKLVLGHYQKWLYTYWITASQVVVFNVIISSVGLLCAQMVDLLFVIGGDIHLTHTYTHIFMCFFCDMLVDLGLVSVFQVTSEPRSTFTEGCSYASEVQPVMQHKDGIHHDVLQSLNNLHVTRVYTVKAQILPVKAGCLKHQALGGPCSHKVIGRALVTMYCMTNKMDTGACADLLNIFFRRQQCLTGLQQQGIAEQASLVEN